MATTESEHVKMMTEMNGKSSKEDQYAAWMSKKTAALQKHTRPKPLPMAATKANGVSSSSSTAATAATTTTASKPKPSEKSDAKAEEKAAAKSSSTVTKEKKPKKPDSTSSATSAPSPASTASDAETKVAEFNKKWVDMSNARNNNYWMRVIATSIFHSLKITYSSEKINKKTKEKETTTDVNNPKSLKVETKDWDLVIYQITQMGVHSYVVSHFDYMKLVHPKTSTSLVTPFLLDVTWHVPNITAADENNTKNFVGVSLSEMYMMLSNGKSTEVCGGAYKAPFIKRLTDQIAEFYSIVSSHPVAVNGEMIPERAHQWTSFKQAQEAHEHAKPSKKVKPAEAKKEKAAAEEEEPAATATTAVEPAAEAVVVKASSPKRQKVSHEGTLREVLAKTPARLPTPGQTSAVAAVETDNDEDDAKADPEPGARKKRKRLRKQKSDSDDDHDKTDNDEAEKVEVSTPASMNDSQPQGDAETESEIVIDSTTATAAAKADDKKKPVSDSSPSEVVIPSSSPAITAAAATTCDLTSTADDCDLILTS